MAVNKHIVIGNLGQNPELKYTPGGQAVTNFSIATNESWVDKAGAKQERVTWHRVTAWGKTAENCAKYLLKGKQVYVEGPVHEREWEDKDKIKRTTREITAQVVQFLSPAGGAERPPHPADQPGVGAPPTGVSNPSMSAEPSFTDDSIPF